MKVCEWIRIIDQDRYVRLASILQSKHVSEDDPLPPTWHWLYTHESPVDAPLRRDGHAAVLPQGVPETHSWRLWTGSKIHIHRHAFVGTHARFTVCVGEPITKTGRSGSLVFVPLEIGIFDDAGCLLTETRTGVYKDSPPNIAARAISRYEAVQARDCDAALSTEVQLDEVALFRYSALLGVCHRIHYDHPYATSVEGYPGLVVHGPLIAQMLVFQARTLAVSDDLRAIHVVSRRPAFVGEPLRLCAVRFDQQRRLVAWAEGPGGDTCMHVEMSLSNL